MMVVVVAVVHVVVAVAAAAAAWVDLGIVGITQKVDLAGCMYDIRVHAELSRKEETGRRLEGKTSEGLNNWT
jgi:hypothetical protein